MKSFDDHIAQIQEENYKSLEKTQRLFYPRNLKIEEAVLESLKNEYIRLRLEGNASKHSAYGKLMKALEYHVINWEGLVQESMKKKMDGKQVVKEEDGVEACTDCEELIEGGEKEPEQESKVKAALRAMKKRNS